MSNPLLDTHELPPFSALRAEHFEPAIRALVDEGRAVLEQLLDSHAEPSEATLLAPIEQLDDKLDQAWHPISHLNGVANSEAVRSAYNACLPILTEYSAERGQNRALFEAYERLRSGPAYAALSTARRKAVDNALRDFRLAGVALPPEQQQRYIEIQMRMAELSSQFSNNVLDATRGWSKHVEDAGQLAGLPESALEMAAEAAAAKGLSGWLFTLDYPSYQPVITYCDDAELRREMYTAYVTRASDQGPTAGQWDNSALMDEILALRHEVAQLLGYANFAELSLATKMAETPQQVVDFLRDLAARSLPVAKKDYAELCAFAREQGVSQLNAWDVPYYSEKLRLARYDFSEEALRPYFPADRAINGLFEVAGRLFGVQFEEVKSFDSWHPDARLFNVLRDGQPVARFYLDLFAREHKRGGAWMADCRVRRVRADGSLQLPVAFLTCNFSPPAGGKPSLLTHDEVTTLFHEFGHGLHHMLTEIDCAAVSGINGVAWDAVELPSQFMENWCWEPEALALISGHYQTGEPLPRDMLDKMLAAKNFQSGMYMMRQLEFSLFDMLLHMNYDPASPLPVQQVLDGVRAQTSVYPAPAFNRFQHGFSHIFAGGYAAGYYSYKWAEVLSADAFGAFEEAGIFDAATGERFRKAILARGGSEDAMALFTEFRGRAPSVDALLRHSGIVTDLEHA